MISDDLISLEQAAILAKVCTATIARWRRKGRLAGYRQGRRALVDRAELERLLAPRRVQRSRPSTTHASAPADTR